MSHVHYTIRDGSNWSYTHDALERHILDDLEHFGSVRSLARDNFVYDLTRDELRELHDVLHGGLTSEPAHDAVKAVTGRALRVINNTRDTLTIIERRLREISPAHAEAADADVIRNRPLELRRWLAVLEALRAPAEDTTPVTEVDTSCQ